MCFLFYIHKKVRLSDLDSNGNTFEKETSLNLVLLKETQRIANYQLHCASFISSQNASSNSREIKLRSLNTAQSHSSMSIIHVKTLYKLCKSLPKYFSPTQKAIYSQALRGCIVKVCLCGVWLFVLLPPAGDLAPHQSALPSKQQTFLPQVQHGDQLTCCKIYPPLSSFCSIQYTNTM